jgi:hypothetical protein
MSLNSMVTDLANGVAGFWIGVAKRFSDARNKGTAYSGNNFAQDVVATAGAATDILVKLFPFTSPTIPTVFFADAGAAFVGQSPTRHVSLNFSLPTAAILASSDLVAPGVGTIVKAAVTVAGSDTEVDITITVGTTKPAPGFYQGVAFYTTGVGTPTLPVAEILVLVTS